MINAHDFDAILDNNTKVVGIDGDKIGGVGQIYVNDATGEASFVTVRTGLFGMRETFVPLDDAEFVDGAIRVPFTAEQVKDAPQVDEGGAITPQDEDLIYSFYGVDGVGGTDTAGGVDLTGQQRSGLDHDSLDRDVHTDRDRFEAGGILDGEREGLLTESERQEGVALQGDPAHGVLEEARHGREAGALDRDWSDADGDGQRLERVDGEHDPADGMVEGNAPSDGGLFDSDRHDRQRLRRYDREVQDQPIRDDVDPQAQIG